MTRSQTLRIAVAIVLALLAAVGLPAALDASGAAAPASVTFDFDLVGSWSAVGNTLFVDPGAWSGSPTSVTPQWYRCNAAGASCAAIAGATGFQYVLVSADLGKTVYARVTATNASGSSSVATYVSGVVGAPTVVTQPVITGDPNVDGTTLSVSHGSWTASPTSYAYQWLQCDGVSLDCSPIPGATSSTYLVSVSALAGDYLTVDVTAANASGSADNATHPAFAVGQAHTDVVMAFGPAGVPIAVVWPYWTGDASTPGDVLVGDTGVWLNDPTSLSYGWYRCNLSCTPILGTSQHLTYTVQSGDAGANIEFAVDAFNVAGQSARYGFYGYLVNNTYVSQSGAAGAPEPQLPPMLTGDAEGAGSVISVSNSNWSSPQDPANLTVTYQWVRCNASGANCAAIAGATSSSYTLTTADLSFTLYVVVDGTNGYGTTSIVSTTITPPIGAPINSDAPVISGDTSGSPNTVSVSNGTWVNAATSFQYQWYDCDSAGANCSAIPGATGASHQLVNGEVGGTLIAEVDATNTYGTVAAFSGLSSLIGAPYASTDPVLTSSTTLQGSVPVAELGSTLSVSAGSWDGAPTTIGYQWYRCDPSAPTRSDFNNCTAIGGATSSSYTAVSADLGHTVYVEVDATNGTGVGSDYAYPRGSVGAPQPLLDDGSITGTAQVGQTLTLVNGSSWLGATPITWNYQWQQCDSAGNNCSDIAGATSSTYVLASGDQGHVILGYVYGSNIWGANGWALAYTSSVVAGASGSGGGGGGGGGGSIPNLRVRWTSVSNSTPADDTEVDFTISVDNLGSAGALLSHLRFTLPATMTLVGPPYYERGSGCTGTTAVDCNLDYIPNGSSTPVKFGVIVSGSGTQTITATASSDRDSDPSDNSATVALQVGSPGASPPAATPSPPPLPRPILRQVNARTLSGVAKGVTETVSGRFTTNEPLRLTMTVTRLDSTKRLALRKGSTLAGKTAASSTFAIMRVAGSAGAYAFKAVLNRSALVRHGKYVVHVTGTNTDGVTKTLAVRFAAT